MALTTAGQLHIVAGVGAYAFQVQIPLCVDSIGLIAHSLSWRRAHCTACLGQIRSGADTARFYSAISVNRPRLRCMPDRAESGTSGRGSLKQNTEHVSSLWGTHFDADRLSRPCTNGGS